MIIHKTLETIHNAEKYRIIRDPDSYSFITVYPPPLTLDELSPFEVNKKLKAVGDKFGRGGL